MNCRGTMAMALALLTASTAAALPNPTVDLNLLDQLQSHLQCTERCENGKSVTQQSCAPANILTGLWTGAPAGATSATPLAGAYELVDNSGSSVTSRVVTLSSLLPNANHTFRLFVLEQATSTAAVAIELSDGASGSTVYLDPTNGRTAPAGVATSQRHCADADTVTKPLGRPCWWEVVIPFFATTTSATATVSPARGPLTYTPPTGGVFSSVDDPAATGTAVFYGAEFVRGSTLGCAASPAFDRNLDGQVDPIDLELALLEHMNEASVCATAGSVQHDSMCIMNACIANNLSTAECLDTDGDGLRDVDEATYGTDPAVAQQSCTSGLSCVDGFNEECAWIVQAEKALCLPRVCVGGACSAFHLETVASDNNELILRVHFDYAPTAPRILDLYLTYDEQALSLVNARPLDALLSRDKDVQVRFPLPTAAGDGNLRLTVFGGDSSLPILPGGLVELVFQRTSPLQSSSAVAFSSDPYHRSYSMAPGPGGFRQRPAGNGDPSGRYLDDDAMWGAGVSIGAHDPDGDQLLLHYSFNNRKTPLDIARVRTGDELCGLIQDCIQAPEQTRAQLTATYASMQRGYSQYSQQVAGVVGSAAFFDGKADHIELPLTFNNPAVRADQSFSLSTWIYSEEPLIGGNLGARGINGRVLFAHVVPELEQAQFSLVAVDNGTTTDFDLHFVEGDLVPPRGVFDTTDPGYIATRSRQTWIHIGMAVDAEAQTVRFYVDGNPEPADTDGVAPPYVLDPATEGAPVCPRVYSNSIDLHFQGRDIPGGKPPERILVATAENNLYGIDEMDTAGLARRDVIRAGDSVAKNPDYSPIADRIVYSASADSGNYEIWMANGDGSDARKITSGFGDTARGIFARRPRWAPDASAIVFESNAFSAEQNDNTWAHVYHLYYIPFDVTTDAVVVPVGDGKVTELNYDDLSDVRVSQDRLLISDHRLSLTPKHHYEAIWLRGRFSEGGVDYRGELIATVADPDWEGRSIYRILIPAEVRDTVPAPYDPFLSGPPAPVLGAQTKLLAAHFASPPGQQPQRSLLLSRQWVSYDPGQLPEPGALYIQSGTDCTTGTQCQVVISFAPVAGTYDGSTCWDRDGDEQCSDVENRDGACTNLGCCTEADCYPSEISDLYLFYPDGLEPTLDSDGSVATTNVLPTLQGSKKLTIKKGVTTEGRYLKIGVTSELSDAPLGMNQNLVTLNFNGSGSPTPQLRVRRVHEQLYVKADKLADPTASPRSLLAFPRIGGSGFEPTYGGAFDRASVLPNGRTYDASYQDVQLAVDGSWQSVARYARPGKPRWERRSNLQSRALLIEGQRTNEVRSSANLRGPGWDRTSGGLDDSRPGLIGTVVIGDGPAPDGSLDAATIDLAVQEGSSFMPLATAPVAASWYARADVAGQLVRFSPLELDFTPGAQWARYGGVSSGSATYMAIDQGQQAVGNPSSTAARLQLWGAQVENGALFPSSYIPTAGLAVTRQADVLTYKTLPSEMKSGRWAIDVWPAWDSTEVSGQKMTVMSAGGPNDRIYFEGFSGQSGNPDYVTLRVEVGSQITVESLPLDFRPHSRLTITVDATLGTLRVVGGAADDVVTGGAWGMPTSDLRIGGVFGGAEEVFARLSEPRTDPLASTRRAAVIVAPVPLVVSNSQFEEVQEAVFSPDGNALLISGIQGARPQLARADLGWTTDAGGNVTTATLDNLESLSAEPVRTAGIDWSRGYRAYPCNWVGGIRNDRDGLLWGAFRGGIDEFKLYNYVRSPDAFASEAARGADWLNLADQDGLPGSSAEVCGRDMDCPPFKLCQSGVCRVAGCTPGQPGTCSSGRCAALPLPVAVGDATVTHACTAECEVDAQCFTKQCKNGPCRFCDVGSNSCIECRETTKDYGSFAVGYIEGCPDRNSFSCEAGTCQTECYTFENEQSLYLCDPALEYCKQGRCAGLEWSWQDLAPATFSGLGETSYHAPGLRDNIAVSQLNDIEIEAFGVADHLIAPEVVVEGRHSISVLDARGLEGGWFELGRFRVHNKTSVDAVAAPYHLVTMRPANEIRFRLLTSPYDNLGAGATGLMGKGDLFCQGVPSEATQSGGSRYNMLEHDRGADNVVSVPLNRGCEALPGTSRSALGYRVGIPEYEARQDCQAKFQSDSSALADCGSTAAMQQDYLYGGHPTVIIRNVEVNGTAAMTPATVQSNEICAYAHPGLDRWTEPLSADGFVHRRVIHGSPNSEYSRQSLDSRWGMSAEFPTPGDLVQADSGHAWRDKSLADFCAGDCKTGFRGFGLLNCNFTDKSSPLAPPTVKVASLVLGPLADTVYYRNMVGTGDLDSPGSMNETPNGCLVEVDGLRSEPCYEMIGGEATLDSQALVSGSAGSQVNSTLSYDMRRSFGYGPTPVASCGDGFVNFAKRDDRGNVPAQTPFESCDPKSPWPEYNCTCDTGNACVVGAIVSGSPATCDVVCSYDTVSAKIAGDGCCFVDGTGAPDPDCGARSRGVFDWSLATYDNTSIGSRYIWDERGGKMYGPFGRDQGSGVAVPATVLLSGERYIQVEGETEFKLTSTAPNPWGISSATGWTERVVGLAGSALQGAPSTCGNLRVEAGETCDDGNTQDNDACSASCTVIPSGQCGNGTLDILEACDDGNNLSGDGCSGDCLVVEVCGNFVLDGAEACDDGNHVGGDGCSANCMSDESCGNGLLDPGEVCDGGNLADSAGCANDCQSRPGLAGVWPGTQAIGTLADGTTAIDAFAVGAYPLPELASVPSPGWQATRSGISGLGNIPNKTLSVYARRSLGLGQSLFLRGDRFSESEVGAAVPLTDRWQRVSVSYSTYGFPAEVTIGVDRAPAQTLLWNPQLEISAFPTSPYPDGVNRVNGLNGKRDADQLTIPNAEVPAFMHQGTWRLPLIPYFSAFDLGQSATAAGKPIHYMDVLSFVDGPSQIGIRLLLWTQPKTTSNNTVTPAVSGLAIAEAEQTAFGDIPADNGKADIYAAVGGFEWGRDDRLEWVINAADRTLTARNLTTGNSVVLDWSAAPAISPGADVLVGRTPTLALQTAGNQVITALRTMPYYGLVGLPAQVCTTPGECPDQCPSDPNKIIPGACGCGVSDAEGSDGVLVCGAPPMVCGNGILEVGEACDPNSPLGCPTSDQDCAVDQCAPGTLTGSALTCDAVCQPAPFPIATCSDGDGCCPAGCNGLSDDDCASTCNNGTVEPGETCDGACPADLAACDDGDACTTDALAGDAAACTALCSHVAVTACVADGCCAPGCNAINDVDCSASCGNGITESGELCDGDCPLAASCDDGDSCTDDSLSGSAATCDAVCVHAPAGAGCQDCGNGVIEGSEQCDDGGESITCRADCFESTCDDGVVNTTAGELCDGGGETSTCDTDCTPAVCGDGLLNVSASETCDDGGESATCDSDCSAPVCGDAIVNFAFGEQCDRNGDGIVPDGIGPLATALCNVDCTVPVCGDGIVNGPAGESCDGDCPSLEADCDDADPCTVDSLLGDATTCTSACVHDPIPSCGVPVELFGNRLISWHRADQGVVLDANTGDVAQWLDQGPRGNDLVATGGQPTLVTAGAALINGQPHLDFHHADKDVLSTATADYAGMVEPQIYAVFKSNDLTMADANGRYFLWEMDSIDPGDAGQFSRLQALTAVGWGVFSHLYEPSFGNVTNLATYGSLWAVDGNWHLLNSTLRGGSNQLLLDDGASSTSPVAFGPNFDYGNSVGRFCLGASNGAGDWMGPANSSAFEGTVAEVIVLEAPPSALEEAELRAYLSGRYGAQW